MNTNIVFELQEHTPPNPFLESEVRDAERLLLQELESAPPGAVVRIDFEGRRVASAAVRGLLRRALRRVRGGEHAELPDRYIVLDNVSDSWHSVDVTMRAEETIVVAHRGRHDPPQLLGKADPAIASTYAYASAQNVITANMLTAAFDLSIAAASNRLATLAKHGLVRRLQQRPTQSGGREYVFSAVM